MKKILVTINEEYLQLAKESFKMRGIMKPSNSVVLNGVLFEYLKEFGMIQFPLKDKQKKDSLDCSRSVAPRKPLRTLDEAYKMEKRK